MTQRQLDLALLGGIGVLLLVILALALSSAPTLAGGDISDPAVRASEPGDVEPDEATAAATSGTSTPETPTSETASAQATETEPVASEPSGVGEETSEGQRPDDSDATNVLGTELTSATDGADPVSAEGETPAVQPTGAALPVERIGFAYATGAEGACGVALEAWAFVAVSRDLLARYPCGTAVTLTLDDEIAGRRTLSAQVGDTMGAEITATVNIFVGQDEPALEYGVTRGTIAP